MNGAFLDLAELPRWLCWRQEERGGKPTKIPFSARSGRRCDATDPRAWETRDTAEDFAREFLDGGPGGLGIALGDLGDGLYLCGLDLDSSLEDGALAAWAAPVVEALGTYAEISPSGCGLKAYFFVPAEEVRPFLDRLGADPIAWGLKRGVASGNGANHGPGVELYCAGRFFAVTERLWSRDRQRIEVIAGPQLGRLAAALSACCRGAASAGSGAEWKPDDSRSARAYRAALDLGAGSYEEMKAALAEHPDPSIREWVVEKGVAHGERELRRIWQKIGGEDDAADAPDAADTAESGAASTRAIPRTSDEALAVRFADRYGEDLRFVAAWGRWLIWSGRLWEADETLRAFDFSRAFCRAESARIAKPTTAKAVASARTVAAVVSLARADRRMAATVEQWDADPWALMTRERVLDLKSGVSRAPARAHYRTKSTAVDPVAGDCASWRRFLGEITRQNRELQDYLQRVAGYALTGSTQEHALFFLYGTGANGKGVFLNTLRGIWQDFGAVAPMATFCEARTERHPTDLAMLRGARLVIAQETGEGRYWDEAKIKALTGGDPIAARFMRQDFFEYTPAFKLLVAGNSKPSLRNVDEAIRRRIHLVPFEVTIPAERRDPELTERLKGEWPQILNWAVEGCMQWRSRGPEPPKAVAEATAAYLMAEDRLGDFIDECCKTGPQLFGDSERLWEAWVAWTTNANERTGSRKAFGQNMSGTGSRQRRRGTGAAIPGSRLTRHRPRGPAQRGD
jgi:putative DNA primase/helicase